jgi:hypothetical protein
MELADHRDETLSEESILERLGHVFKPQRDNRPENMSHSLSMKLERPIAPCRTRPALDK